MFCAMKTLLRRIQKTEVRLPSGLLVDLRPKHRVQMPDQTLLLEDGDTEPIRHIFELRLWGMEDRAVLAEVQGLPCLPIKDHEAVVARLEVREWPDSWRRAASWSWFEILDQAADPFIELVDALAEDENETFLLAGSFFALTRLHVHPHFRSQDLGLLLLAHGMLELERSCDDIFALEVVPLHCIFTDGTDKPLPNVTARDRARLARYYKRLGFREFKKDKHILWLSAQWRLPFRSED